ncbi:PIR Superfamily Protein [Plasmodium ovale curtisi]|uniref:PIR Superfamily Protein n=1 Tax=Plasmodium ovale curtisi TaxID=864141 RepID=A0A1A8WX29_PLAOA|nr:PIR Superfamily Protein [Plasmodium ovale curtisi]
MAYRVDILKNKLQSVQYDIFLNNPVSICSKCNLCDVKSQKNINEPWFKFFCYQFVKNLETTVTVNKNISPEKRENRCNNLIYWMYNRIETFYRNSSLKNNEHVIPELLRVWKNFNDSVLQNKSYAKCQIPDISKFINLKEMKRRKIMSDYCEDYNVFQKIRDYTEFENCHIYYDYFKDSLSKYKEETVLGCKDQDFFMQNCLSFCSNADPYDVLNKSKCKTIEIWPEEKKNDYMKKGDCEKLKEPDPKLIYEIKEVPVPEFTFSDKRAIILILFSLWGIFLTLLFLYKMTPFRLWIISKLGKKKIIRDNFNEQSDDETLDADYENMGRNMKNAEYSISYNSDWNSTR